MLAGNDWVALYSDVQDAYHVERREEYRQKGPTNGNWRIVGRGNSWEAVCAIVEQRRQAGSDKPCQ